MAVVRGFRAFLLRGNVIDLAVGVVVGTAFNGVVQAIVRDFISPLIAMTGGQKSYVDLKFTAHGAEFAVGDFINALISFLIVAGVVYFFVVAPFTRLAERLIPQPKPAPTRECPFCLSNIPEEASKCMFCTSDLKPTKPGAPDRSAGKSGDLVGAQSGFAGKPGGD